jgi:CzcA family heavy metal efflux pump
MNLETFSMRHERLILFVVSVLVVLGVWSYLQTRAAIFPTMKFSRVDVVADAGNLPPEQMHVAVGIPLERAFMGLPYVQRVITTSSQGETELVVDFDASTNVQTDLQYVDEAVSNTRSSLPSDSTVNAEIIYPQTEPILSYAFTSKILSQTMLHEYARLNIVPELYGLPGLWHALLMGGPQREYHVLLDPGALAAVHLTPMDVVNAIAAANDISAVGISHQYSQQSAVLVDAGIRDAAQLERIVVPTPQGPGVTLASLGTVRLGTAPPRDEMDFATRHGVGLSVYELPGTNTVQLADAVKAKMHAIEATLPRGIVVHKWWDATKVIVASQGSLRDAMLIGALLAIGVIFFFLRNLRITGVAAIVIPAAMAIAVLAIHLFHESLNIMSLGGLAIAVGLIIDDAIVVVEGIAHTMHEQPELSPRDAVAVSMRRLIAPMATATFTTVVVFVPLSLLTGVPGAFFKALALTLSCALIVSLGLALFVTPTLFRRFLATQESHGHSLDPSREAKDTAEVMSRRYEPILRWALSHRPAAYGLGAGILVVTFLLLATLPTDFLPKLDEGQFEIAYRMPVGTTLAATDAASKVMQRVVMSEPGVISVGSLTGIDTNGFSPTPVNVGTMRVMLKPLGQRAPFDTIANQLRGRIGDAVPAAQLNIHQILEDMINDVEGNPSPIELVISGPSQAQLVEIANRVSDNISRVPSVKDVFSGVTQDEPTMHVAPDLALLQRMGVDPPALASSLSASTQGTVATQLPESTMLVPVRVAMAGAAGANGAIPDVVNFAGGPVPFAQVAKTNVDRTTTNVTDINGIRSMIVTANTGRGSLSSIVAGLRRAIVASKIPPGYVVHIEGAYQAQQQSFREFATVMAVGLLLVFSIMLASFKSFRQPLVILTTVPLAPIGVALGLVLTSTPFNVSSFMGLLLLIGLVVKNGILLIDAANRRRREGLDVTEALVGAGQERLRPILMTTFATIGGLLPLALGIGTGAAMEKPLAIAVVGGLCTATLFTLILIPVFYATFCSTEEPAI